MREKAVESAVVEYLPYLFGIAYNLLGNLADAEDAVQESAYRFLHKKPSAVENLRAYLGKTVANYCMDQLKKRHRPVSLDRAEDVPAPDFSGEPDAELGKWLSELSPKDRLVMDLFYREGLSLEEIAEISGDTAGAVKVRLHRARNNLRKMAFH